MTSCFLLASVAAGCGGGASHSGDIPPGERAALLRLAEQLAKGEDDAHPYAIRVIRTTTGAVARVNHERAGRHNDPIYVLEMRGNFHTKCERECEPGERTALGAVLEVGWEHKRESVIVTHAYPNLTPLGQPVELREP